MAALRIFPPHHIYVIAYGDSPTPLDDTEEVCRPQLLTDPVEVSVACLLVGIVWRFLFNALACGWAPGLISFSFSGDVIGRSGKQSLMLVVGAWPSRHGGPVSAAPSELDIFAIW